MAWPSRSGRGPERRSGRGPRDPRVRPLSRYSTLSPLHATDRPGHRPGIGPPVLRYTHAGMRTIDLRAEPHAAIPRPRAGGEPLDAVREVIAAVRGRGDRALVELTERFDGARLDDLRVPDEDIEAAAATAPEALLAALHEAPPR